MLPPDLIGPPTAVSASGYADLGYSRTLDADVIQTPSGYASLDRFGAASYLPASYSAPASFTSMSGPDMTPYLLAGGAALLAVLLLRRA